MQIVVNSIVVKLFSFLDITRPHYLGLGPYLVRLKLQVSRSFLHTVYPSKTARKRRKSDFKIFENSKNMKFDFFIFLAVFEGYTVCKKLRETCSFNLTKYGPIPR